LGLKSCTVKNVSFKKDMLEGEKLREMYNEIDLDKIDLNSDPPTEEPARQYYFMAKCREWVRGV